MKYYLPIFLLFISAFSFGNNVGVIKGKIINVFDQKIDHLEIYLSPLGVTTLSDNHGSFVFTQIPNGSYQLFVTYYDQLFSSPIIHLNGDTANTVEIAIDVQGRNVLLEEVVIRTKSEAEKLKNTAIKADILNLKKQREQSNSLEEIMNKTPGIKIRNTGGLGSTDRIVIGGFSGNAVKFLYDNIPIDYLGSNYGLAKIPINNLNRVEIYKGVLPSKIGVDALGGAVNLIPDYSYQSTASLSYETGSYHTHILSGSAQIKLNKNLFIGTHTFYNRSKNNYEVDHLPFRNPQNGQVSYIREQLFHNGFRQFSSEVFIQGRNLKWADLIEFKINHFSLHKEIQNDAYSRSRPFGQVFRKENGDWIPSLKFKKYFLDNKLNIQQFLVLSTIHYDLIDTLKNKSYDWKGSVHQGNSGSEMGSLNLKDGIFSSTLQQFTSRSNFNYLINSQLQVEGNIVAQFYNRKTNTDTINLNGTHYRKMISNLALNGLLWDEKLESNTQIKYLNGFLKGYNRPYDYPNQIDFPIQSIANQGWSFSQALKYNLNQHQFVRFSYENTFRLPEQEELFGDNNLILPNYSLKAEKSHNFNLGYVFDSEKLRLESNIYYRITSDLIRLKSINQYQALFMNLDHVKGLGVEMEASYQPIEYLFLSGNLTWNNYRLSDSNDPLLMNQHFKKARIANMPFYFTNLSASYNFKGLLQLKNDLNLFWDYSYVHQYYLDFIEKQFEPDGFLGLWGTSKINTSRIIPVQHLQNLGITYHLKLKEKHHIALNGSIKNLLNSKIYNEFKMQSPGRHYRFKITYSF